MGFLRDDQGRLIRKDGSLVEGAQCGRAKGPGKKPVAVGADGEPIRVSAHAGGHDPRRGRPATRRVRAAAGKPVHAAEGPRGVVRHARGHKVCLTSIRRHRNRYLAAYQQLRLAAKTSAAFSDIVHRDGRGAAVHRVAQAEFEMKFMQDLKRLGENVPAEQWLVLCKALSGTVESRRVVNAMRVEFEERARRATEEAQHAAKKGATGAEIAERVRQILGA